MKIFLASDHAGFELKEKIKALLAGKGYEVEDYGAYEMNSEDDYPDFMRKAAEAVAKCEEENSSSSVNSERKCSAIIFGGSGQGEAMVANRIKGARAAVLYNFNEEIIKLSREHNNANVLSLGARFLTEEQAIRAVELWLATPFSNEPRHKRRIDKF